VADGLSIAGHAGTDAHEARNGDRQAAEAHLIEGA
jgi:hypothetical protein